MLRVSPHGNFTYIQACTFMRRSVGSVGFLHPGGVAVLERSGTAALFASPFSPDGRLWSRSMVVVHICSVEHSTAVADHDIVRATARTGFYVCRYCSEIHVLCSLTF